MAEFFDPRGEIEQWRQNLPHWQQGSVWVFVTWRLADSVPQAELLRWKSERAAWRAHHPEPWDGAVSEEYRTRFSEPFETWLDRGHGTCLLRKPANRTVIAEALHHFEGERYRIGEFVIMPNHVHVLFSILGSHQLAQIVHSWKRHTARQINAIESRTGTKLWQADYFDRLIRSQHHLNKVVDYIRGNPKSLPPGTYTLSSRRDG